MSNDAALTTPGGGYHASGVTLGLSDVGRERTGVKYKVAGINLETLGHILSPVGSRGYSNVSASRPHIHQLASEYCTVLACQLVNMQPGGRNI